jgi:hypothetical protein
MESAEFVEPAANARRSLVVLYVAAIVVGALLVFLVRPALLAFIKGLPACEQARWSFTLLAACLLPLPVVAVWASLYARRLLKFNQSPLPNAWVWLRTPVRRGRPVRVQAYALIVCAAVLVVAPLHGWQVLQPMLSALRRHCGA